MGEQGAQAKSVSAVEGWVKLRVCAALWRGGEGILGIQMLELEMEATVSHNLEEVAAVFQK